MSIEQAKAQVASIQQSAKTDDRWKHEPKKVELSPEFIEGINRLFSTLEAVFPAWRVSMKSDDAIANVKRLWAEELMRFKIETGSRPNIAQGVKLAKQSESDFFPSIGKFLSWCNEDGGLTGENEALQRFNDAKPPITYIEQITRSRCGYKAKRMSQEKGDRLFLKIFREAKASATIQDRTLMIEHKPKEKTIFTRKENQAEINSAGINSLPKELLGDR